MDPYMAYGSGSVMGDSSLAHWHSHSWGLPHLWWSTIHSTPRGSRTMWPLLQSETRPRWWRRVSKARWKLGIPDILKGHWNGENSWKRPWNFGWTLWWTNDGPMELYQFLTEGIDNFPQMVPNASWRRGTPHPMHPMHWHTLVYSWESPDTCCTILIIHQQTAPSTKLQLSWNKIGSSWVWRDSMWFHSIQSSLSLCAKLVNFGASEAMGTTPTTLNKKNWPQRVVEVAQHLVYKELTHAEDIDQYATSKDRDAFSLGKLDVPRTMLVIYTNMPQGGNSGAEKKINKMAQNSGPMLRRYTRIFWIILGPVSRPWIFLASNMGGLSSCTRRVPEMAILGSQVVGNIWIHRILESWKTWGAVMNKHGSEKPMEHQNQQSRVLGFTIIGFSIDVINCSILNHPQW